MTIAEVIEAICPELFASPKRNAFIALASEGVSKKFFGAKYGRAVAYRACHLWSQFGKAGGFSEISGNPVSGVTEGGLSVSFAVPSGNDNEWSGSKYGKMYLSLVRSIPTMGVNTGACYGL